MTNSFRHGIARATDLTRAGKLKEATDAIQALLGGKNSEASVEAAASDDVIDGTFTPLDQPTPKAAGPKATTAKPEVARSSGSDRAIRRGGLAETLRKIAAGGMPAHGPLADGGLAVPPGAQFLSLTHTSPAGSLAYRLYVPSAAGSVPMPLVVMLHGCTQTPEDFAAGTRMNVLAEEFGCLVAYPAQPTGANAQKCWNWFRPGDQGRGEGEPALFAGLVADVRHDHAVDPSRISIAGLSAGAAAALVTAAAYPEVFSAVGAHSGLPAGSARDVASAFSAMRSGGQGRPQKTAVRTIVFHGTGDATVHPGNAAAIMVQAMGAMPRLKTKSETGRSDGGRNYRRTRHVVASGIGMAEQWEIDGAGHAWAGGAPGASYTDPTGPDASREMLRFFFERAE